MRKVIKILGMILSTAILLLAMIPILLSIMLSLPEIQNRIIDRAAKYASEYIGAEVSIGKIDVSMTGRVSVDNFLSRDLVGDTLIYVKHLDSRLLGYRFATNNLLLGSSNINGGKVNIQELESGEMNIRQVSRLLTPERASLNPLQIVISSIAADSVDVIINRKRHFNPTYGVDLGDLELKNISLNANEFLINGPAIHAYIEQLSFVEKSGFVVRNITGELYLTQGAISISEAKVESMWSELTFDHIWLADKSWQAFSDFNNSTLIDIEIMSGHLSSDDVAYFAPKLRTWGITLQELSADLTGRVNNLNLNILNATLGEQTDISADISFRGLPNIEQTEIFAELYGLTTDVADIEQIKMSLTANSSEHGIGEGFSRQQYQQLEALGRITAKGSANGKIKDFNVDLSATTNAGDAFAQMKIRQLADNIVALNGAVQASSFDLKGVTQVADLGSTTLAANVAIALNGNNSSKNRG